MKTKKILLSLFAFLFGSIALFAQNEPWVAPKEYQEKLSPFKFDENVVKEGKAIFLNNCKACHGDLGGKNFLPLVPSPGDPSDEKFQKNTDGSLYYKITTGRGLMTPFKEKLTPEQIWKVIGYIRTSHKGYTQKIAEVVEKKGYDGEIKIDFTYEPNEKLIKASLFGIKDGSIDPLSNVDVKVSAKRYFGKLALGEVKATNSQGNVYYNLPETIPGDSSGNITIVAQLSNVELFGTVVKDTTLALGVPTFKPSLVANRAMWNKARKAPLWVLFSYGGGVLLAWSIIFYILFQIRSIFYIGSEIPERV